MISGVRWLAAHMPFLTPGPICRPVWRAKRRPRHPDTLLTASIKWMARPTFLVAETEPVSAISARKLVLETAKFNVVTAHTSGEANEFLDLAPQLYAALIITSDLPGAAKVARRVKDEFPRIKVISISPNRSTSLKGADEHASSHEPETLVEMCREMFGDPRKTK